MILLFTASVCRSGLLEYMLNHEVYYIISRMHILHKFLERIFKHAKQCMSLYLISLRRQNHQSTHPQNHHYMNSNIGNHPLIRMKLFATSLRFPMLSSLAGIVLLYNIHLCSALSRSSKKLEPNNWFSQSW